MSKVKNDITRIMRDAHLEFLHASRIVIEMCVCTKHTTLRVEQSQEEAQQQVLESEDDRKQSNKRRIVKTREK